MIERIKQYLKDNQTFFTDKMNEIWEHPELAYNEYYSYKVLADGLKEKGFAVETGIDGIPTAFKAVWGSGKPVIGFLAEYDALSGLSQKRQCPSVDPIDPGAPGHGCGHNTLGVCCAAAACAAKSVMEQDGLPGTLIVFGCPAEEQGCGKSFMTRDGVFDELDIALAPHPGTDNVIMADSMLANIQGIFRFKGTPAHASSMPDRGRSALDAADLMIMGTQFLREHVTTDARIHYAYLDTGGTAPNVVQSTAALLYYMRAPKVEQVQDIYTRMVDIARGAALMTGTQMEYSIESAMRELVPNDVLGQLAAECWKEIGTCEFSEQAMEVVRTMAPAVGHQPEEEGLIDLKIPEYRSMGKPGFGSTDVGDVSIKIPTVMIMYAGEVKGTPGHSWQLVAQSGTPLMQEAAIHCASLLAGITLRVIQDPAIVEKAKEELMQKTGCNYVSLIPEDVKPPIKKG
ncbi:MAG: amidohydrolase [Solobacterium sp.]|nr:amidohydrolase [Solobacterium sp.]